MRCRPPPAAEAVGAPTRTAGFSLDAVRSWSSGEAREWTLQAVRTARSNEAATAVVASGSTVRDVEYSDDLDLVMVYRNHPPDLRRRPIDVDLRLYEQAAVLQKLAAGDDYLSWTVRYGHALFERDAWWTRLYADWNDRLTPPSAVEARAGADRTRTLYDEMLSIGDLDAAAELRISMLTHLARAALSKAGVFPKSRPELSEQLRSIGEQTLADRLAGALARRPERQAAERPARRP